MEIVRKDLVRLTAELAIEIYTRKLSLQASTWSYRDRFWKRHSILMANSYKVSAKTVMDIWNRKTWVLATSPLWGLEP